MKYRLKDRELQKKLDELSDGDFSARLHKERELIKDSFKKEPRLHVLWFGEGSQFSAALYADMLEEVREYDPTKWNNYPEVEPPEGVWMRVEWRDGVVKHLAVARYEAWGGGKQFVWVSDKRIIREVDRFRPRDDPDGEEDEEWRNGKTSRTRGHRSMCSSVSKSKKRIKTLAHRNRTTARRFFRGLRFSTGTTSSRSARSTGCRFFGTAG